MKVATMMLTLLVGCAGLAGCWARRPAPHAAPIAGVCTHFAQRPGSFEAARPLLGALGVASIRDEAYWSHIEKVKGVLVFPPRLKDIYLRLGQDGLRPLIVLDYGNPLYDQGRKPRSPEAVAAFAGRWGISEALKADYAVATFRRLSAHPRVKGIWRYDLVNDGPNPRESEHRYGLVDEQGQPLPAFQSLAGYFKFKQ